MLVLSGCSINLHILDGKQIRFRPMYNFPLQACMKLSYTIVTNDIFKNVWPQHNLCNRIFRRLTNFPGQLNRVISICMFDSSYLRSFYLFFKSQHNFGAEEGVKWLYSKICPQHFAPYAIISEMQHREKSFLYHKKDC